MGPMSIHPSNLPKCVVLWVNLSRIGMGVMNDPNSIGGFEKIRQACARFQPFQGKDDGIDRQTQVVLRDGRGRWSPLPTDPEDLCTWSYP